MSAVELENFGYYVGAFFTHPSVFVGVFRYIFYNGWTYPFFSIMWICCTLWLVGIYLYFNAMQKFNNINTTLFFMRGFDLAIIGTLYGLYYVMMAWSVYQPQNLAGRYMLCSAACDVMWVGIFSGIVLKRSFHLREWGAFLILVVGYLIYEFCEYNSSWELNFGVNVRNDYVGPLTCIASRALFILMCIVSKRLTLKRGFEVKAAAWEDYKKKKDAREALEQMDAEGHLKKRVVRPDSIIFQRAMMQLRKRTFKDGTEKNALQMELEEAEAKAREEKEAKEAAEKAKEEKKKKVEPQGPKKYRSRLLHPEEQEEKQEEQPKNVRDNIFELLAKAKQRAEEGGDDDDEDVPVLQTAQISMAEKSLQVETMLEDYEDIEYHMHLFDGYDDITLSKLDMLMENVLYDFDLCGISPEHTWELHGVAGALMCFPIACIATYIDGEVPDAWNAMVANRIDGPFGNGYIPLVVAVTTSVLFATRPFFLSKMIFSTTPHFFFGFNCFCQFFVTIYSMILIDKLPLVPSVYLASIFISAVGYVVYYWSVSSVIEKSELNSNLDLIRAVLPEDTPEIIHMSLESHLNDVKQYLGMDTVIRILLDMVATRNYRALKYTASPNIGLRVLFDKDFFQRTSEWGGGYPRPLVEAIEQTYKSGDEEKNGFTLLDDDDFERAFNKEKMNAPPQPVLVQNPSQKPQPQMIQQQPVQRLQTPQNNRNYQEEEEARRRAEAEAAENERRRQMMMYQQNQDDEQRRREYEQRLREEEEKRRRMEEERLRQMEQTMLMNQQVEQEKMKTKNASVINMPLMAKPTASVLRMGNPTSVLPQQPYRVEAPPVARIIPGDDNDQEGEIFDFTRLKNK